MTCNVTEAEKKMLRSNISGGGDDAPPVSGHCEEEEQRTKVTGFTFF